MLTKIATSCAVALASFAAPAAAEWAPEGPVTMMIMFPPGGGGDVLARAVTKHLDEALGWNVVVDNRPGGGGAAMAKALKDAPADGHTIGMGVSETYSFIPIMNPAVGYTIDDVTFLGSIADTQIGWIAAADAPWNDLNDLVEAARSGEEIEVGVFSPRANAVVRAIGKHFDVEFIPVPLEGGLEGIQNVLNGHLDTTLAAGPQAPHVRSGAAKVLVGLDSEPLIVGGEVGKITDYGVDAAVYDVQWSFFAPPGLPEDIRAAWTEALASTMENDELRDFVTEKLSLKMQFTPGDELRRLTEESGGLSQALIGFLR